MVALAVIAEGFGDVAALPPLIGRAAAEYDCLAYALKPVIRVGGCSNLLRVGQLERWLVLAAGRADADAVLVVLDVDEGCPVQIRDEFEKRTAAISGRLGKPVLFCLIKSEFETWFLSDIENLSSQDSEYEWSDNIAVPNPERIRGAKEYINTLLTNTTYKETRDQEILARMIDVRALFNSNRSFKRFVKCITGLDYAVIEATD